MKRTLLLIGIPIAIILAAFTALMLTNPDINPFIEPPKTNPCAEEELVDFSKLKPIETSLTRRDLILIYRAVLDPDGPDLRPLTYYLNPLAPPVGIRPWTSSVNPTDRSLPSLPQELAAYLTRCYTFAFFDEVWDGKQLTNERDRFYTVSAPLILSNGTIVIETHNTQAGTLLGPGYSSSGLEYRLSRDSQGNYYVISIARTYIAE